MFVKHRACILINDIGQINGVPCYEIKVILTTVWNVIHLFHIQKSNSV